MMNFKVYISVNELPNTNYTLSIILDRLEKNQVYCDIFIVHDSKFNPNLFVGLYNLNLNFIPCEEGLYEYPTLQKLWLDSKNEDFYALYLHAKGSSKIKYSDIENSIAWMDYMLYGVLDNHTLCIEHMNSGADIVGSMWYNHFKGNFFWCKSSYVRTLFDPYLLSVKNRFVAEYWISIPFDEHWTEVSKKIFGLELIQPSFKNLFYLPLESDYCFAKLKKSNYIPNIKDTIATDNIVSEIEKKTLIAHDKVWVSKKDFEKIKTKIKPYLNYDADLIITE